MNSFRRCQSFFRKALVLLRYPSKWHHFVHYSGTKLLVGNGVARIPQKARIRTSTFSEYLAVYGLLPNRSEQEMLRKHLAYAQNVFDVGANVGVWTVLMSKFNPSARIHSFEPNSATFNLLQANVNENSCGNAALINAAASDQEGTALFEVPPNASIFGRIRPTDRPIDDEARFLNARASPVLRLRLADYCRQTGIDVIDFMKMDIEGHELPALRGLQPLLSDRRVKALYVETIEANHTRAGSSFSAFVQFVNDCGYELWTINEQGEPNNLVHLNAIKAHNHLCLPTGCD
jgi:FkbM family methyltransferase